MIVDALVPCYNEAPRLVGVLKSLQTSPLIHKIILVDGGSTDGSVAVAQTFSKVEVLALGRKGGKGQDVKLGLKKVTTSAVFLCDADLLGLTQKHVEKIVGLYEAHPEGLVVGLTQKSPYYFVHWLRANLLPVISGMRVLSVSDLEKVLSHPLSRDWGIEVYMNYYFAKNRKPLTKILLDEVNDLPKPSKGHGWKSHLWEAYDVAQKYFLTYGKELPKDLWQYLRGEILAPYKDIKNYPTYCLNVDKVKINYALVGQGPFLILIHGWASNWEGWKPLIPNLKNYFRLYLVDLPGFGDSGSLEKYSVEILGDYLFKFIKALPQKPLAVVAASMGAMVTTEMLLKNPETVNRAVLIGAPLKSGRTGLAAKTLKYSLLFLNRLGLGERGFKKLIETRLAAYAVSKYVNMYRFNRFLVDAYNLVGKKKMRREAFTQMGVAVANYPLKSALETLSVKTLLIYGREDKVTSPAFARNELLPRNPNLSCVEIPEAGHVVPLEKPQEVAAEIIKFVNPKVMI